MFKKIVRRKRIFLPRSGLSCFPEGMEQRFCTMTASFEAGLSKAGAPSYVLNTVINTVGLGAEMLT